MNLSKGLSVAELEELIGERDYRDFLNPRNELYRERRMDRNPPAREEALRLMSEHPNLIRRPILVQGKQVIIGFNEAAFAEAAWGKGSRRSTT